MKKFFKMLFSKKNNRVINFERTTKNVVQVFNSKDEGPRRKKLYYGFISSVNFTDRCLVIDEDCYPHTLPFDNIVTMSRMDDGRIRIWINEEEATV